MALAVTNVASGFDDGATDITNPMVVTSATFTSGRLYLLSVANSRSGGGAVPTSVVNTTGGDAWTKISTDADAISGTRRLSVYRYAPASTVTSTVTVTFPSTSTAAVWVMDQVTGQDTSGTNGSGAIVQSVTNNNTGTPAISHTITLAAFADAVNNAAYGAFATSTGATLTQGSGFTKLAENEATAPTMTLATEWRTGQDTSVDMTAASGTPDFIAVAVELKAAAGASGSGSLLASSRNRLVVTA